MTSLRMSLRTGFALFALMLSAAAVGQYALDAALDANPRVGGTGYNSPGRGNAGSLRAGSYRLNRSSGNIVDAYQGNSAFLRPEYSAGGGNIRARGYADRAGLSRDQVYPSYRTTVLRQDDVQYRLNNGAYAPNDPRGGRVAGGLQAPTYKPYASTTYANPERAAAQTSPPLSGGETPVTLSSANRRAASASNRAGGSSYWTQAPNLSRPSYIPER